MEEELEDELKDRNFNRIVDEYLQTGRISVEGDYHALTPLQRDFIQTIKRSFKRITHHENN